MKHTLMPKHTCQICSKSFEQFIDFNKHMEIHSLGSISKANSTQTTLEEISENVNVQDHESVEDHLHQEIMGDSLHSDIKQQDGQEIFALDKVDDKKLNYETNPEINETQKKRKNEIKDKLMNPHKKRKMFNFEVNISSSMYFY